MNEEKIANISTLDQELSPIPLVVVFYLQPWRKASSSTWKGRTAHTTNCKARDNSSARAIRMIQSIWKHCNVHATNQIARFNSSDSYVLQKKINVLIEWLEKSNTLMKYSRWTLLCTRIVYVWCYSLPSSMSFTVWYVHLSISALISSKTSSTNARCLGCWDMISSPNRYIPIPCKIPSNSQSITQWVKQSANQSVSYSITMLWPSLWSTWRTNERKNEQLDERAEPTNEKRWRR